MPAFSLGSNRPVPKFARLADRDPRMVRLAQQVAARLEGSAEGSPEGVLETMDDVPDGTLDNDSFLHELDRLVFVCQGECEHWTAQSQNANPGYDHDKKWICRDCAREENS